MINRNLGILGFFIFFTCVIIKLNCLNSGVWPMSFSVTTKNELARLISPKKCCQAAELSALIRMDGLLYLDEENSVLRVFTENAAVARKIVLLLKQRFNLATELEVQKKTRLKKNNIYMITVPPQNGLTPALSALGLITKEGEHARGIQDEVISRECCRRAYLRGVFMGAGSVNNPEGTYHLEIITNNEKYSHALCELLNVYNLSAKISTRKNWYVIYLKESEHIIELLSLMGAHSALLEFENVRIIKEMRNQVNRQVNCETANLNKIVDAAMRQVECIELIKTKLGVEKLPPSLRDIAEVRLQYPDLSFKELGEILDPPVSKSAVNHRMRKIEALAEKLRVQSKGDNRES